MSWFGFFDPDFDDFFGRPRKYATEVPPNFNPRKIAQGDNGKGQQVSRYGAGAGHPHRALARRDDFFDDFWKNFSSGKYFVGFDDNVKTTEESDKYMVSYDQENLSPDEVNVDFDKQENELIITVTQETEKDGTKKSSTFHSNLKFEKPVNFDDISAEIGEQGVQVTLPKVHADHEKIVNIPISKAAAKK